jgi:hypothetical protein
LPEITAVLPRRTGVGFGGSFQSANRVDQQSFISYSMHPEQGILHMRFKVDNIRVANPESWCGTISAAEHGRKSMRDQQKGLKAAAHFTRIMM